MPKRSTVVVTPPVPPSPNHQSRWFLPSRCHLWKTRCHLSPSRRFPSHRSRSRLRSPFHPTKARSGRRAAGRALSSGCSSACRRHATRRRATDRARASGCAAARRKRAGRRQRTARAAGCRETSGSAGGHAASRAGNAANPCPASRSAACVGECGAARAATRAGRKCARDDCQDNAGVDDCRRLKMDGHRGSSAILPLRSMLAGATRLRQSDPGRSPA